MTKRVTEWLGEIIEWLKENWAVTIWFALSIVAGIVICVLLYNSTDTIPATAADYTPLEQQMSAIQQNPDILLKTDCSIDVKDELITVTLRNKECKLATELDQNFNVVSAPTKIDLSSHWLFTAIMALIAGAMGGFAFLIISGLILIGIKGLTYIVYKFRQYKRKNQNN